MYIFFIHCMQFQFLSNSLSLIEVSCKDYGSFNLKAKQA